MVDLINVVQDWLWPLMGLGLVGLYALSRLPDAAGNWLMAGLGLGAFVIFTGFLGYRLPSLDLLVFIIVPMVFAGIDFYLTLTHREPHDASVDDLLGDKDIA